MTQLIIFVLALAFIYVVKAGAVMLSHRDLAEKDAAFSWVVPEGPEDGGKPAWIADEEARKAQVPRRVPGFAASVQGVRHAGA